ncbi:VanZ family protein [Streptomyces sp. NPDC004822]
MLDLVFGRHLMYVVLVILVSAGVLAIVGVALGRHSQRPWEHAAWAASTTAAVCLTLWVKTASTGSTMCVVNKDVIEPFGVAQGWMNLALFVPVGFFGLRAVRRPVPPVLLAVLLSCGIEGVQAVVPAIGRHCDTTDVVANSVGAIAGAGLGFLSVRLSGGRLSSRGERHLRVSAATCAGFAVIACVPAAGVEFRVVDHAEPARAASAEQRAAITDIVHRALGGDVRIVNVSDVTPCGLDGVNETVSAELEPGGAVLMPWPDRSSVGIDVWEHVAAGGVPSGRRIPGAVGPVHDAPAARRAADRYVAARFPGSADEERAAVDREGEGSRTTWTVAYPFHDPRLPAMNVLRVTVDGGGRLLSVHLSATPPGSRQGSRGEKTAAGRGLCP